MRQLKWASLVLVVVFAGLSHADVENITLLEVDYSKPPDMKNTSIFFAQINTLIHGTVKLNESDSENIEKVSNGSLCDLSLNEGQDYAYISHASEMGLEYVKKHKRALFGKYKVLASFFLRRLKQNNVTRVCDFNLTLPAEKRLVCAKLKEGKANFTTQCIACYDEASLEKAVNGNSLRETTCKFTGFGSVDPKSVKSSSIIAEISQLLIVVSMGISMSMSYGVFQEQPS